MTIKIKRVDASLPLPEYATSGSVCFDLLARTDMEISPHETALIPTNVIVQTPPGYMFVVVPRSSTPRKKGLLIPHGIGVIDQDYCGPEDEVLFQVLNFTDEVVKVEKGERLAQGCFMPVERVEFEEVAEMDAENRGGIGSTG